MTRSPLRRSSAAAVAVLALASLAACGDDEGDGDATSSESSDSTTDDTGDDTGADPDGSEGTEGPASDDTEGPGEEIEKSEFIDLYLDAMDKATTATIEMAFGGTVTVEGEGSADFTKAPPSMELTISDASTGQDQTMIIVDGIMYLGLQPERYLEYDLSDPNSPLGTDLTDQLDPSAMADVFEKGITRASYQGEEQVEGESMEHYRVMLDSTALLDEADLPSGAPSDAVADELTFDLWFDDEGNFRRQEAVLGAMAGSVELSYDNWGEPVDIEAPPESQITKLPGS
jgi:hypothetical protein